MNRTPPTCRSGYRNSDDAHLLPCHLQSTSTQACLSKDFIFLLSSFFAGHPRYRRFKASHWLKRPIAQGRRDWLASAVTGSIYRAQWVIDCAHTTLHNHEKYNVSSKGYKTAGSAVVAGSAVLRNPTLTVLWSLWSSTEEELLRRTEAAEISVTIFVD